MIEQCRKGNIGCIVVKDLSRLGRNYVEVGNLLEQLFPFLGIRVISVNDGYDNFESKHQVDVEKSEWIVVRNTHEGIVTQEEFDRANANMRDVVRGKKKNAANKGNYSVIVCPYCGLTLRQGNKQDLSMHCPTGRMHRDSPCSQVRIRRKLAEETLVSLVRQQAQMLVDA